MMKRLFACIFLLIPAVLFAQVSPNVNVPANGVASTVIPISSSYQNGNVVRVTNGSTSTDCTTGGGTNAVLCYWTGSAWAPASGSGVSWAVNTVTFSATPVFNASLGNVQKITLTGNVTSSTLTNAVAGQLLTFDVCQDATGGRSFVWPTNMVGTFTVPQGANQCVRQSFAYDGTNAVAQDASQGEGFLLAASSALEPNARTLTCGSGISCVDGGAGGSFSVSGASLVDLTSAQTITGTKTLVGPLVHQFANAASPGTTQYESVMFGGNGTVTAGTSATGILGVCIIGCGTSGSASVAVEGVVNAMFDTASITAGDYVTATASGTFHDTGSAAYPASGQVQGKIITSGTTCNTSPGCPFLKFPEEIEAASGGASAWSALTNAGANLSLSNAAYSTTFNQTSPVNWLWANTTAATSSVEQDSPIFQLEGNNWSGATPASAADSWTIQDVTGAGANPVSTLTFSHSGSSTASPNAQVSLSGLLATSNTITAAAGSNIYLKTTNSNNGVYFSPGGTTTFGATNLGAAFEEGGDTLTGIEGTCNAPATSGDDILCLGNSTAHDAELSLNGAAYVPIATVSGTITAGDCAKFVSTIAVGDSGSACGGSGLPSSWSVSGTSNAVTGQPLSGHDAVPLTLAPNTASPTADIFDVCSQVSSGACAGTKYFGVGATGSLFFNASNLQLATAGAAPYVYLNGSGGNPNQPYFKTTTAALSAPFAPAVAAPSAGGSLGASVEATVEITYINAAGETVASASTNQATATSSTCPTSGSCEIVVTSPAANVSATGYNVYANACATAPCSGLTKQNASAIALGTNYTWSTLASGAAPPGSNTTGGAFSNALQVSGEGTGFCLVAGTASLSDCAAGAGVTLPGGSGLNIPPTAGATTTAATLACFTASGTVGQCASNAASDIVGVFQGGEQNQLVQTSGIVTINLAAASTTTVNHFACTNATAGTIVDSASACASGQQVGIITQTNASSVTSVPVLLNFSSAGGGGGATILACVRSFSSGLTPGAWADCGNGAFAGSPSNVDTPFAVSGTAQDLYVTASWGATGANVTLTVNVNGTDQALTCTLTFVANSTATCSDTTHTVTVNAGNDVGYHLTGSGAGPSSLAASFKMTGVN